MFKNFKKQHFILKIKAEAFRKIFHHQCKHRYLHSLSTLHGFKKPVDRLIFTLMMGIFSENLLFLFLK